jgi:NADH-quinone oxidoreductase subunit L
MMAALGAATSASSQGWFASLFHLISHAFFQGLGFLAIGGIIHALGTRDMRQMGGLRKMLPITFILCIIVLFARTGVPPFASFFSKGLIISSLWSTSDILLVLTIYGALAITFAYTLRFTILVFFRKASEYIKHNHIHEPPKTMLFASGILAALCLVWGFLANYIAQFMQVNIVFGVNEIFSSSTLIFLLCLLIGGIPVYLFYYRPRFAGVVTRRLAVLNLLLDRGFFFDDFYEKIIARGIRKVADAVGYLEVTFFTYLPYAIAKGVKKLGYSTRKYSNMVIETVQYIAAGKGRAYSLKLRRTDDESIQDSIAAALLGLLIIIAVILIRGL